MTKHFILTLILLPFLSACGFTPVHAPQGLASPSSFSGIRIETSNGVDEHDKTGAFFLRQRLVDRLGSEGERYVLRIQPTVSQRRLGLRSDDVATRSDITLQARYQLVDARNGEVLDKGRVRATSTFGSPTDSFGRLSAEDNAVEIIAGEAADRLLAKIAAYYATTERP